MFEAIIRGLGGITNPLIYKNDAQISGVAESSVAYGVKHQGEYTMADYYALPDERRVELIDGELYDMAAPTAEHQLILGELYMQFRACAQAHGMPCRVFLSPCDVQLDSDDKTMVQPDLFVLCRDFDPKNRYIIGAPDLTIEILSDAAGPKDLILKTYKYKNAGVCEYWIIDPAGKQVLVYDFSSEEIIPERFSFFDEIPVHIFDEKCVVDFGRISRDLGL